MCEKVCKIDYNFSETNHHWLWLLEVSGTWLDVLSFSVTVMGSPFSSIGLEGVSAAFKVTDSSVAVPTVVGASVRTLVASAVGDVTPRVDAMCDVASVVVAPIELVLALR